MDFAVGNKTWLDKAQTGASLLSGTLIALSLRRIHRLTLGLPLMIAAGIAAKRKASHSGICYGIAAGLLLRGVSRLRDIGSLAITPAVQAGWGGLVLGAHFFSRPNLRKVAEAGEPSTDEAIANLKAYSDQRVNDFSKLRLADDGKTLELDGKSEQHNLAVAIANLLSFDLWKTPYEERRHEASLVAKRMQQSTDALLGASDQDVAAKGEQMESEVDRFNALLFPPQKSISHRIRAHYASFVGTANRTFLSPVQMHFCAPELRVKTRALHDARVGHPVTPLQEAYVRVEEGSLTRDEGFLRSACGARSSQEVAQRRAEVEEAQRQAIAGNQDMLKRWKALDLELVRSAHREGILQEDLSRVVETYYKLLGQHPEQAATIRRTGDLLTEEITTTLIQDLKLEMLGELGQGRIPSTVETLIAVVEEVDKSEERVTIDIRGLISGIRKDLLSMNTEAAWDRVREQAGKLYEKITEHTGTITATLYQLLAPKADAEFDKRVGQLPESWRTLGAAVSNYQKLKTQLHLVAQTQAMIKSFSQQYSGEAQAVVKPPTDFETAFDSLAWVIFAEQDTNLEMLRAQTPCTAEGYARIFFRKCEELSIPLTSEPPAPPPGISQPEYHRMLDAWQNKHRMKDDIALRSTSIAHLHLPYSALVIPPELGQARLDLAKQLLLQGAAQAPTLIDAGERLALQLKDPEQRRLLLPPDNQYQLRLA